MLMMGIDPGYDRLGLALVEEKSGQQKLIFSDCLTTSAKAAFSDRLLTLGQQLEVLFEQYHPNVLALEKLFFTTNQKTASKVSEVRGMIIYLAAKYQITIVEYTPLQVKSTVGGYGKATKEQVSSMVRKLIKLPKEPAHDDEFDAIAIALTALAHRGLTPSDS